MEITNLWDTLPLPTKKISNFRKDISEGKVPELPFSIIGHDKLKQKIKQRIEEIDSSRMITNLIIAEYGNGKTNFLKYLQLFFKTYDNFGITVEFSRADIERTDLVLFLLKIIQDKYLNQIIDIIKTIRNTPKVIPSLVNNYESNFREIQQITEKLFDTANSDEAITEIFYLASGRLSNKRYFDKLGIEQIHDFNRREILVLFLNILSHDKKYIIFAVDEIEKIREKSKIRFNHFLTSYRELVDLFNQINGHYLIVSFTDSTGSAELSVANGAFYSRIKDDIAYIEPLKSKKDIEALITYLNELFLTNKNVSDIYKALLKKDTFNTRIVIQEISKLLYAQSSNIPLSQELQELELTDLFDNTKTVLENDEAFKYMHRKFFDPFEYYLDSLGQQGILNKQERTLIDENNEQIHYFIFNTYLEDFENETIKIKSFIDDYSTYTVIVYAPITLELSHSKLDIADDENLQIIDLDQRELFILLVMYRDNFDLQPALADVISNYTKHKL